MKKPLQYALTNLRSHQLFVEQKFRTPSWSLCTTIGIGQPTGGISNRAKKQNSRQKIAYSRHYD